MRSGDIVEKYKHIRNEINRLQRVQKNSPLYSEEYKEALAAELVAQKELLEVMKDLAGGKETESDTKQIRLENIQKERNFQIECLNIIDELLDMRNDVKRFADSDGEINTFLYNRFQTIDNDLKDMNERYVLSIERMKAYNIQ